MNQPGHWNQSKVDEVVNFIESLTLTKATKSQGPEPFVLLPHCREIVEKTYGPRRHNGRRVVEKVFASFGRKQAKTQTAAGIATYEFFMGDEPMQEIYFVATAVDQAAVCYEAVANMIAAEPELSALCRITESMRRIVNETNGNILRVLSADGKKHHGYNPSVVIFDELHAWGAPEQELYDALTTGSMSRPNPLWIAITTAGSDPETICGREYEYACKVRDKKVDDPSYLPIIYEVPKDADWTDRSLWPLALPLLKTGHHDLERYEREFAKAQHDPSAQNKFRRLYLNQWTSTVTQWLPLAAWDALTEPAAYSDEYLAQFPVWGGLDLGASNDLAALALCFRTGENTAVLRVTGFLPESTIEERSARDGINYRYWVEKGWLIATNGKTVDFDEVFSHIEQVQARFDLQAIAYDRWRAKYIEKRASEAGIQLLEWGQGFQSMTPAIEAFEDLVHNARLSHDGNGATRWNIDCCQLKSDGAGNKKLIKPPVHQKSKHIDLAIAAVMAVGASFLVEGVYDPYAHGAGVTIL